MFKFIVVWCFLWCVLSVSAPNPPDISTFYTDFPLKGSGGFLLFIRAINRAIVNSSYTPQTSHGFPIFGYLVIQTDTRKEVSRHFASDFIENAPKHQMENSDQEQDNVGDCSGALQHKGQQEIIGYWVCALDSGHYT